MSPTSRLLYNIHQSTVTYNLIMMYIFVVIGGSIVPVLSGGFISFNPPFTISDQDFTSVSVLMTYIVFAMVDQVITVISEELGNISGFYPENPDMKTNIIHLIVNTVVYWQKLVFKYIVIRSQFAIILAVIVADLSTNYVFKDYVIRRRMNMPINKFLDLKLIPEKEKAPTDEETARFYDIKSKFLWIEIANMLLLGMVYMATGTTDTLYFSQNLPVDLVGHKVDNSAVVFLVMMVVLFDQMGYGLLRRIIDEWFDTHVKHPDTEIQETTLNMIQIMFIHKVKRIVYWSRLIFSLSFLTTRYYFVIPYTLGEIASGLFKYLYYTLRKSDSDKAPTPEQILIQRERQADVVVFGTVFMVTELIIIGMVMIIPDFIDSRYFEWPQYIEIFRNIIDGKHAIILIMIYAAFFQIGATLINELVIPDFYNWMYNKSSDLFVCCYGFWSKMWIVGLVRFDAWFRFVIIVQLVLSNLFFVIIVGVVDIIVSTIIMYHYIAPKNNDERAVHYFQSLLDDLY